MVAKGLAKAGYTYLNTDDCWCTSRGSDGRLVPDPTAFPNGMKAVADYVHSKGLKFGIYVSAPHSPFRPIPATVSCLIATFPPLPFPGRRTAAPRRAPAARRLAGTRTLMRRPLRRGVWTT